VQMTEPDLASWLFGFVRALRDAGVEVDPVRVAVAGRALAAMTPLGLGEIYWATRVSVCSRHSDLPLFDAVFAGWSHEPRSSVLDAEVIGGSGGEMPVAEAAFEGSNVIGAQASDGESVTGRDLAKLSPIERAEIDALIALLVPRARTRRSMRHTPGGQSRLDASRTFRTILRSWGEPARVHYRRRRVRPRRLVLLLDVSGSMNRYRDAYLRFAHAAVSAGPRTTEVFALGTRYERITAALSLRDPDRAIEAMARVESGWGGGTRLGAALRDLLRVWSGRDGLRSATVVIASDGWEEGAARVLSRQVARLSRLAEVLIWVDPQAGQDGFRPVAPGLVASLPYVDEFLPGRSFADLTRLAKVIAHG
jgi:uncharacterized protein with von Willebrand factor type A (vWA) domain